MNVPNALTLLRIFFVPLLVAALVQEDLAFNLGPVMLTNELFALAIFLTAAGTDLLDGYLARRWKQITTVGTLLDPIADKLLISAALISLVQARLVPAWMTILIVGREFAVSGLRSIAAAEGFVIKANDFGKTKLVTQVIGISLLLLSVRRPELHTVAIGCMWLVVITTVLSAFVYFRSFWRQIDSAVKRRRRHELLLKEKGTRRAARTATASQPPAPGER